MPSPKLPEVDEEAKSDLPSRAIDLKARLRVSLSSRSAEPSVQAGDEQLVQIASEQDDSLGKAAELKRRLRLSRVTQDHNDEGQQEPQTGAGSDVQSRSNALRARLRTSLSSRTLDATG